ncbi:MAG: exodeoxyribonuclease III [Flavobacteriales bacterium]|nr:MAG: exodeoxyribonuclease III [Flavobacteriales bacterium]
MKLISWNLNGIRAVHKKGLYEKIETMNPDIICFQETKAQDDQVAEVLNGLEGYHFYSNSAVKKGYSGTAIVSKAKPLNVTSDIGMEEHDQEGRVITAEFDEFYITSIYTPNSKNDLSRLADRQKFDASFLIYLKELEKKKPVIVCGDFNVAHKEIDLARPKPNYNKSAGFMQEEIDGMDNFTNAGLVDTFRHLHPTKTEAYSWWSYRGGARDRNVGWRIDYFLVSKSILKQVETASILSNMHGSDHCPVEIDIKF